MKLFPRAPKLSQADRDAEVLRRYREGELPGLHRWDAYKHRHKIAAIERAAMREAEAGPYPVHGRNIMAPRMPFTWFVCNNGHREIGSPVDGPRGDCHTCEWDAISAKWDKRPATPPFSGWTACDESGASSALMDLEGEKGPEMLARTREGL